MLNKKILCSSKCPNIYIDHESNAAHCIILDSEIGNVSKKLDVVSVKPHYSQHHWLLTLSHSFCEFENRISINEFLELRGLKNEL